MFSQHIARDDRGASAIEYGLLVVAIAATVTAIVFVLGIMMKDSYVGSCSKIANEVTNGVSTTC